jgi:hypothetical protein
MIKWSHAQLPYQIIKTVVSRVVFYLGWDELPHDQRDQGAYSTAAAGLRTAVMLVFETMLEANFQPAAAAFTGIPCKGGTQKLFASRISDFFSHYQHLMDKSTKPQRVNLHSFFPCFPSQFDDVL